MGAERMVGSGDWLDAPTLNLIGEVELKAQSAGVVQMLSGYHLSLVTFLQCSGPASRAAVIEALWGGRAISARRVANLVAEVRTALGRDHFPEPVGGRYRIIGFDTDLARLERLVAAAAVAAAGPDDVEFARVAAMIGSLVRGVPFSTGGGRHWAWLDHRPGLLSHAESTVSTGLQQLADLAMEIGRPGLAGAALESGLLGCPWDEDLVGRLAEIYLAQRRPGLARHLVNRWEVRVRRLDCGEPSSRPRQRLMLAGQAGSMGSAVTTKLPR